MNIIARMAYSQVFENIYAGSATKIRVKIIKE